MKNSKKFSNLFLFCFCIFISESFSQCPVSNFSVASPICSGLPLQITNNSTNGTSFKWDFTPGFFDGAAIKSTDTLLPLNFPGDITLATENDTDIVFISGYGDGKLHRIIYGNGAQNPITSYENLGSMGILYQPTDIALYKQGATWYGVIVDYGSNYLFRIRFGNSLKNIPDSAVTVLNNVASGFNNPASIKLITDSTGSIYAVVSNYSGGSISILSFGNSILNTPTVNAPVVVPGTTFVHDAIVAKDCGNWYAFLAGNNSTKIIRADFGNSIMNAPSFTTIISSGAPSDLVLVDDSSSWKLLCTDFNSYSVKKYDLGPNLTNNTPVLLGSDYFAGQFPKGICSTRKDNTTFVYVLYSSHNVETFSYTNNIQVNKATSTDFAPNDIVFNEPGTFPITLMVTDNNGNWSTQTDTVVVAPAPQTDFVTTNKCFGDATSFADFSVLNSGTITSWKWNFGDGDSAITQNTTHSFDTSGSFNVRLITASSFGCYDTLVKQIDITPKPEAFFSSNSLTCSNTELQYFDATIISAGTIDTWIWEFGNGDSSTVQNPVYSYSIPGNYMMHFAAISDAGCMDTTSLLIVVNERPRSGFIADNTCIGQNVIFTDTTHLNTSSIISYEWDFGDSSFDLTQNPVHNYGGVVATYQTQFIATAANGCVDTTSKTIKINNVPTVDFLSTPTSACQNNNVSFTDLSSVVGDTIGGWLWDYGDGTYDTIANPVHQFAAAGIHSVNLIAYSPSRCPGNPISHNIDVKESPVASFTYSTTCIGNTTQFINTSTPASGSTIDSIIWRFSPTDSASTDFPNFFYASPGTYPVTLTVISPEGCTSTDTADVQIFSQPVAAFTHTTPCTGDSIRFTNISTSDSISTINQYDWNFGDFASGINNNSTLANPTHKYNTTQSFIITLITTTNFGCKDTAFQAFSVSQSPVAQFSYSPTCYGDLMEFFNTGSSLDSCYLWSFGDSQTNPLREPAHYYAFPGTYTVKLHVTARSGCATDATKQVTVSPIPTANFSTTPACVNTNYQFQDQSTISSGSIDTWNWSVAGLTAPNPVQNPDYLFTSTGSYNVTLTIASDIGCSKSVSKVLNVYDLPVSSFNFDPQFGNPPLEVQTTDLSTGGQYNLWDFGDGSAVVNLQEPSHIYNDTGLFVISQFVTSMYGCKDTSSQNIYVINPILDIAVTGDSSYFDGDYFHVVGKIENRGTREINSVHMEAWLENGNTIREDLYTTIPTGPEGFYTYPFHASFLIGSESQFNYYCIQASKPNGSEDTYPENNERCFNLSSDLITMDPFPNPFTKTLTLRFLLPQQDELKIDLVDMMGRTVKNIFEGKANKNLFEVNTDLSDIADGTYSVKILYRDRLIGKNVVKQSGKN